MTAAVGRTPKQAVVEVEIPPHTNAQSPNLNSQRAHLLYMERIGRKGKVWGEVRRPDQPPVPRVALQILLAPQVAFMRVNKSQNDRVIFR